MIRTNFYLTERQVEWLKGRAERSGLTVSELIRRALDAEMEKWRREHGRAR